MTLRKLFPSSRLYPDIPTDHDPPPIAGPLADMVTSQLDTDIVKDNLAKLALNPDDMLLVDETMEVKEE